MPLNKTLTAYLPLVVFLADCMGENTEVVLHDLTDWHESVVAIRNGHISGRQIGSPVTDLTLNVLKSAAFEQQSHMANYQGIVKNGHRLKSSTFFIKDETGKLVGLLCINTDYHELLEAHDKLGALIGELGLRANLPITESFNMNVRELVQANLHRVCPGYEEQVGRMSQKEKLEVIEGLSDLGTFLVKGAIGCVAESLGVSVPTIYRYLNVIKK